MSHLRKRRVHSISPNLVRNNMGKNKSGLDGSKYSSWFVLDTANSYYMLSNVITSTLPETMVDVNRSALSMSAIAASATNRIFALELYLKALLIGGNQFFPKDHDLKILFDSLKKETRQIIKEHFDQRCKVNTGAEISWELSIFFRLGGDFDERPALRAKESIPTDPSLSAMLVRNRHGFAVSRYLFEQANHNETSSFDYEYRRLAILCSILCEALENSLPTRPSHYRRTFQF